jgi:hypothetical protein
VQGQQRQQGAAAAAAAAVAVRLTSAHCQCLRKDRIALLPATHSQFYGRIAIASTDLCVMSPVCLVLLLLCTAVSGLEFLELNMTEAGRVEWDKLAMLPALHSLMLVPPISPHSSGHGPEHAQQVRLSRDSCCFRGGGGGKTTMQWLLTCCCHPSTHTAVGVEP